MLSIKHKTKLASSLISSAEEWKEDIIIDDEDNPNRKFGDKFLLQVPENHVAGGYRIGQGGGD